MKSCMTCEHMRIHRPGTSLHFIFTCRFECPDGKCADAYELTEHRCEYWIERRQA